ncbi:MAG: PQQ-binding-like beta-propeller repeat protein [Candidatus Sericytochromatia bacterium]
MVTKYKEYEKEIINKLIEEKTISREKLEELSEKQANFFMEKKHSFFDKVYLFDSFSNIITILNSKLEKQKEIKLPFNTGLKKEDCTFFGTKIISFDEEHTRKNSLNSDDFNKFGIGIKDNKGYLYTDSFEFEEGLIFTNQIMSKYSSKNKIDSLPLDFTFSYDYSILVVSNRNEGKIYIIDTKKDELLKEFEIRAKGQNKALNIAIATKKNKVFVTDNQTTNMSIINLENLTLESKNLGFGILGNILLSPDEEALYLITTKPKQLLKLINTSDLSNKKDFALKGELFSLADSAYDILCMSKNKDFVYLVTHIAEPDPFTPVITVFDTKEEKAIKRFSIKDNTKPIFFGFYEKNPLLENKKEGLQILLDNNIVNEAKLEEIKNKLIDEKNLKEIQANFDIPVNQLASTLNKTNQNNSTSNNSTSIQKEEKKEEIQWKINLKPRKIEYANITPGLDKVLFKKCKDKIWREYEDILRELSKKEEWEKAESEIEIRFLKIQANIEKKDSFLAIRLNDAIVKSRSELEWHDCSVIRLKDLLENYHFEISFTREDAIEWIRELERDSLIESGLKTIATNCPNCDAQLLGSYTCRICGFELEKPEDAIKRKLLQVASYEPFENLRKGHFMVIDVLNHKIMEIDPTRKIVWEARKDALHAIDVELERPRDAVRLKNNINLIVDYAKNRVFKLTPKGRLFWELDYKYSEQHEVNNPVSVSGLESGNVIVVDFGNHRVFEVNEDQEILWQYGQKGKDGISDNMLRRPTFCQRTSGATNIITDAFNHRVIEIQENKIIWQYGNENNVEGSKAKGSGKNQLNTPLSAWRMGDGTTLILDSGNKRVIEVSLEKEILWEYKTDQEGEEIENPIRTYKLRSGNVLIVGDKKILEVDYRKRKAAWLCPMESLMTEAEKEVRTVEENIKKTKVYHGVVSAYSKKPVTAQIAKASELLNSEGTRKTSLERAIKPHVINTPGAKVSDIEITMADKSENIVKIINRKGEFLWTFGENGVLDRPSFILEKNNSIFIADTDNKRVLEVDKKSKNIIWSYEPKDGKILGPKSITMSPEGNFIIADSLGAKVFEVTKTKELVWEYDIDLKSPFYAKRLSNGNTFIVDWMNHFIVEVNKNKEIIWTYGTPKISGKDSGKLSYPEYADRLENGNTLIADTRNSRIIEVSPNKEIVWSFEGQGVTKLMSPSFVKRLPDGNTLIIHNNNRQVIEVDNTGKILWKFIH